MTKQQILNVLYPVRQAYREAIEDIQAFYSDDPYEYIYGKNLELGLGLMCLKQTDNHKQYILLVDVLRKDLKRGFKEGWGFWYPVADDFFLSPNKIIPKCLQPRLDHLNRTIARLENEINEYT